MKLEELLVSLSREMNVSEKTIQEARIYAQSLSQPESAEIELNESEARIVRERFMKILSTPSLRDQLAQGMHPAI